MYFLLFVSFVMSVLYIGEREIVDPGLLINFITCTLLLDITLPIDLTPCPGPN